MFKSLAAFATVAIVTAALLVGFGAVSDAAQASNYINQSCGLAGGSSICTDAQSGAGGFNTTVTRIINGMLLMIGIVATIAIIIGGIRYATSNGDANQTKTAKNTIMYAVIGLIVAILSYAIVNFILDAF
ncbi:hypothetical protein I8H89_04335 [Candidatus Saccharibacteria bacterium]|nr:hypothetical protein [Candidatus Saccharibacteria bacterium]